MNRIFLFFTGLVLLLGCEQASGNIFITVQTTATEKPVKKKRAGQHLGLVGKMVSVLLKGKFAKDLFAHYWTGGGTYYLDDEQAVLIATEINKLSPGSVTDSATIQNNGLELQRKLINFYSSKPLVDAIGYGTVYFNGNVFAGFYDDYDFNPKHWGVRPFIHEVKTRLMHVMGKIRGAKAFKIYYGDAPGPGN